MTARARALMVWHATELAALLKRMDPKSHGYKAVALRCKQAQEILDA